MDRKKSEERCSMPKMLEDNIGVAIITSLFHPYYGGAEKQLERLAEALSSRGVKCYVLTRRLNGLKPFEYLHNVSVHRVFATRMSSGLLSTLTFFMSSCLFFIGHTNVTRKVQILQADSDPPGLVAVIVGKFFKKKVIIRMRGTRQIEGVKSSLFKRIVFKIIMRLCDAIVVQYSQIHDLRLLGVDDSKVYLIPNGVDTKYFKKSRVKIREHLQEKMGFKNSVIGLYIGRLDPIKGLDILLEALPRVVRAFAQFRLIIVGSGPHRDYLKNLVKDLRIDEHVVFRRATRNVKRYYEVANIFILPSRSEGISNALLEAMSMELAVIATEVGGTPEVIKDLENGCLVTPSSDAIAEKLQLLIANKDLRNRLGKAARKTVTENYSLQKIAEIYVRLYRTLVVASPLGAGLQGN